MNEEIFDKKRECPYRGKCGACQTLNLTYGEELSLKMRQEIQLLGRFGHVEEIIPMENPEHYRAKVQYITLYNGGRVNFGLYRSSDGGIVRIDKCLMEDETASRVARIAKKTADKLGLSFYDGKRGLVRHFMVRRAAETGEVLCAVVTSDEKFDKAQEFARELAAHCPEVTVVSRIINDTRTPMLMNGEEYVILGKGYITDKLCGCEFRISAKSFFQINPRQTEILYRVAAEMADLDGTERVADAYCGIGTVGITAVKNSRGNGVKLSGFDINPDAVRDAEKNAELNGIKNAEFRCISDGGFALREEKKPDVLFMDPPRAGCDKRFLSSVLAVKPNKIVYISCAPDTLARDLAFLKQAYKIEKIQPVDMFPGTRHVETVVLLSKAERKAAYRD